MFSQKIKHLLTLKRIASTSALVLLIFGSISGYVLAQTVTQGYSTDQPLQKGMVVGITEDDPNKVEAINIDEADKSLGVVVNSTDSPITISEENQQVFVATVGRYEMLVSDQQGPINVSDYVSLSSLDGIGMLATFEQGDVLGRAITGFNGSDNVVGTSTLKDTAGNEKTVNIGKIEVDIALAKNPLAKSAAVTPEWLGTIGQAIAGKNLSPARIYIGTAIFLIGAFIAGAILYSGIRSSIISIGRNPLSKKSILRGLLQVVFTSLIVFIISVGGVYLILRA